MRVLACLLLSATLLVSPVEVTAASVTLSSGPDQRPAPARDGVWPLTPRPGVVSGFDPPSRPWASGHRGVDLLGHAGQLVRTSLAGKVTFAARVGGRGVVVVGHGVLRTTYEPVSPRVQRGDVVSRGEVIGTLRPSSSHCFPRACLHWGLRRGETYLDPLALVGAGPLRLLPLVGWPSATGQTPTFLRSAITPGGWFAATDDSSPWMRQPVGLS